MLLEKALVVRDTVFPEHKSVVKVRKNQPCCPPNCITQPINAIIGQAAKTAGNPSTNIRNCARGSNYRDCIEKHTRPCEERCETSCRLQTQKLRFWRRENERGQTKRWTATSWSVDPKGAAIHRSCDISQFSRLLDVITNDHVVIFCRLRGGGRELCSLEES